MQQIFIELSKYIFAFLIAFYTLASYQGAVMQNEQKRGKIYFTQNVLMFIIHLLGYLILYILNDEDMKYIMLYFVQFIYLFVVVMIYDVRIRQRTDIEIRIADSFLDALTDEIEGALKDRHLIIHRNSNINFFAIFIRVTYKY